MSVSVRYKELTTAISTLRNHFLPPVFDPTGTYDDKTIAYARAFRILAHAEIEHFLEDRTLEVARSALNKWKQNATANTTLLSLLAFSGCMMNYPPDSISPAQPNAADNHKKAIELDSRIDQASRQFHTAISENHGIKEKNVLRLLLAVGIKTSSIDQFLLIQLNSLGEKRGEAAHQSLFSNKVSHPPDPKSELDQVNLIINSLEAIDLELNILM